MSDIKHLVHTGIKITISSLVDVLRQYRIQPVSEREVGYVQGIEDAIKAVQLFQLKLEEQEHKLDN